MIFIEKNQINRKHTLTKIQQPRLSRKLFFFFSDNINYVQSIFKFISTKHLAAGEVSSFPLPSTSK